MSQFHQPLFRICGAGKRALFMSKKLGFKKLLGQRGAIDGDKRLGGPGTIGMSGAGDDFFAGARFAED
jgi:hypothetical protein